MIDRILVTLGRRLPKGWHQQAMTPKRAAFIARHLDR